MVKAAAAAAAAVRLADNDLLTCRFSAHSSGVFAQTHTRIYISAMTCSMYKSRVDIQFEMHFSQFVLAVRLHGPTERSRVVIRSGKYLSV